MTVFLEGDSIYHSKVLTFYRKEPFALQVQYKDQKALPVSNYNIGMYIYMYMYITHHFRHAYIYAHVQRFIQDFL